MPVRYEDFEGSSKRVCHFMASFLFGSKEAGGHENRMRELVERSRKQTPIGRNDKKFLHNGTVWSVDDILKVSSYDFVSSECCVR